MHNQAPPLQVGYLVNQYPKVSHSFIRREIAGIESCGIIVRRFSVRSCEEQLVDPLDLAEFQQTFTLLIRSKLELLHLFLMGFVSQPLKGVKTLFASLRLGLRSDAGVIKHGLYFVEACILRRWCQLEGIDHLHAHFGTNSATLAMLCHHLGGPNYSFTVHGPEEFDRAPGLYLDEKIRHASFVIAISSFGRSQLYRLCELSQWSKLQVVHCGIDNLFLQQSDTQPKAEEAQAKIDHEPSKHLLHQNAPVNIDPIKSSDQQNKKSNRNLVCVGRLCPQKGQLLLLEAVQQLRDQGFEFSLTLVGDGPMRSQIEAAIAAHQLESIVTITGWVEAARVHQEIQSAIALVLPSLAEGLPVVLMEAMGLRKPVVTTYIAGIPELVEANTNGWIIPAGSVEQLTASLKAVLQASPEQLAAMGEAGHAAVAEQHSIHTETQRLAELFRQARADKQPVLQASQSAATLQSNLAS